MVITSDYSDYVAVSLSYIECVSILIPGPTHMVVGSHGAVYVQVGGGGGEQGHCSIFKLN